MPIRKICVDEVTTINNTFSETVTCTEPNHTPTAAGDECNVHVYNMGLDLSSTPPSLSFSFDAQFGYQFHDSSCATFNDFCNIMGNSGSVTLPAGATVCCDGDVPTDIEASADCDSTNITTTPTSVSGPVSLSFTVTNLCTPTILCVEDTTCP